VDTIKQWRRRKGWTQADLAREAGVHLETVSSTLQKLAGAFDVEVEELFDNPKAPAPTSSPKETAEARRTDEGPSHQPVSAGALREEMKRMKLVEKKRQYDIENEKQERAGRLDDARVWEMEAFDRTVREDYYVGYVEGVVENRVMVDPAMRTLCQEFKSKLRALEDLTDVARSVVQDVDMGLYVRGVKTASKAQEHLSQDDPQRETSEGSAGSDVGVESYQTAMQEEIQKALDKGTTPPAKRG
jgi:transcriptional regulator with XRE-family HTH domain